MRPLHRAAMAVGACYGALGVVMAALAGHAMPGSTLGPGAQFLLIHGVALVALGIALELGFLAARPGRIGTIMLMAGTALFSGDMAARAFLQAPLFPMAAPGGGFLMIGGWLIVGFAALVARTPRA